MSTDLITSWKRAEDQCFRSLQETIGGMRDKDAFIGYLPEAAPNVWGFSSGGNAETQIDRLLGTNPCFAVLRFSARAFAQYVNRDDALAFSCGVIQCLQDTQNMRNVGNVNWLRLTGMPEEPQLILEQSTGYYLWQVTVPMELIFSTVEN